MQRSTVLLSAVLLAILSLHCRSDHQGAAGAAPAGGRAAVLAAVTGGEEVTIVTEDKVVLTATLYRAGDGAARTPAVLCLHQWRNDRSSYADLAQAFVRAGITVLAVDMRGNGGSVRRADGSAVQADRLAGRDVAAAVAWLRAQASVDPARIGIVGASYGASNALQFAAAHAEVAAIALLSPGVNYFNVLPTEDAIRRYRGRPLFLAASADDVRSAEAVALYRGVRPDAVVHELKRAGHGTEMLASSPALLRDLAAFFTKNL